MNKETKVLLSIDGLEFSATFPYIDASCDELIEAFAACLIGHTFTAKSVYRTALELGLNNLSGEEINEILTNFGYKDGD